MHCAMMKELCLRRHLCQIIWSWKNCNFLVLDANLHSCYILPLPSSRTLTTMPCCIKLTFMNRQTETSMLETWLVDTFTPEADGLYNPGKPGASSRQMVRHTVTHTVWNLSCTIVNLANLAPLLWRSVLWPEAYRSLSSDFDIWEYVEKDLNLWHCPGPINTWPYFSRS